MKSTVEKLSPTRVRINVEVPFDELQGEFDRAYKQLAQQVKEQAEEAKVALRNFRRDAIKHVAAEEKAKALGEDDARKARDDATDLVHNYEKQLGETLKLKTDEIMEV